MRASSTFALFVLANLVYVSPAHAQLIPDDTLGVEASEVVPIQPGQAEIDGGALRGNNLFHSFSEFNVEDGGSVYFRDPAEVENILTRVTGDNASNILGTLGVQGDANLFLLNPNGIIFGPNSSLDVQGSFVASTGDRLEFADGSTFSAVNPDGAPLLEMNVPIGLQYGTGRSGSIINAGELTVDPGENLTLTGETVINTGTLTAPGGEVAIAAISGPLADPPSGTTNIQLGAQGQIVEITSLADLQLPDRPNDAPTVPELLANTDADLGLALTEDGQVIVADSGTVIPTESGDTLLVGGLDAANLETGQVGGRVQVLGDRVALVDSAQIDVSGDAGGGIALIGGDFQGQGSVLNAQRTYIGSDVTINADAITAGNGGQVIAWADEATGFYGTINASGGETAGNGGFVEVSGKQDLLFRGTVDVGSIAGNIGTLLLDPTDITIVNGDGAANDNELNAEVPAGGELGQILSGDPGGAFTISEAQLEGLDGNATVILQATNNITINDLLDNTLSFARGTGTIELSADADQDGVGAFTMNAADTIQTNGRDITISGATLTVGNIDTTISSTVAIDVEADGPIPQGAPFSTSGVAQFIFNVPEGLGTIQDLDVRFSARHTYVGDLRVTLTNPGNISAVLFDSVGGSGDNFQDTVLDSDASVPIQNGFAPFNGTYTPQDNLQNNLDTIFAPQNAEGEFIGDPTGTWTLTVDDQLGGDSGRLFQAGDPAPWGTAAGTQLLITGNAATGDGGTINLTATNGNITAGDLIASSRGGVGGNIEVAATGGDVTLTGSQIISNSVNDLGGFNNIRIQATEVVAADGASSGGSVEMDQANVSVENTLNGFAGDIFVAADNDINITGSTLSANGNFGRIFVGAISPDFSGGNPERVTIRNSQLTSSNANINGAEDAGEIEIQALNSVFIGEQSSLVSTTIGDGIGGLINIDAGTAITIGDAELTENAQTLIDASTRGAGPGGDVQLDAPTITLQNSASLNASTFAGGEGGTISIGQDPEQPRPMDVILEGGATIFANPEQDSSGRGGNVAINADNVSLDGSNIDTRVRLRASGQGGLIDIDADEITLSNFSTIDAGTSGTARGGGVELTSSRGIQLVDNSRISADTQFSGTGGTITLSSEFLSLQGNSILDASTSSEGLGGDISITTTGTHSFETQTDTGAIALPGASNTQTENFGIFLDNSIIRNVADSGATATGGNVEITTDSLALRNGARISAQTVGASSANAGNVSITATRLIDIRGRNNLGFNSGIATSSETPTSGSGGNITINEGTAQGTLTLADNGFLSALTRSNSADAGNISVNVETLTLERGGQIVTASTTSRSAGEIIINATEQVQISGEGTPFTSSSPFIDTNTPIPLTFGTVVDEGLQEIFDGASYALRPNEEGTGNFAYFSFQVTSGNSRGVFDIDNGFTDGRADSIDTELFLFNQNTGSLLASNDDASTNLGEGGSASFLDSFIDFTFAEPGSYVIGVGRFNSSASDGALISGAAPLMGQTYDLRVSLQNADDGFDTVTSEENPNPNLGLSSGLLAEATGEGGNAGLITIEAPELNISDGGRVASTTLSGTSAGIEINEVASLDVQNGEIITSTQTGIAGNININASGTVANRIDLQQGGRIAAEATGNDVNSRAGNIEINARTIDLADESEIATRNVASEIPNNEREQFGNIRIEGATTLSANNSLITASTESGTAGSINITANAGENPAVTLSGINSSEGAGGVIAEATNGGSAGDIILNTGSLTVNANAQITARSVVLDIDGDEGPDTDGVSTGTAGTVDITANGAVTLTNARISTTNENAPGGQDFGNISIEGATTISATNGLITASTAGGNAGNIEIDASESIVLNGVIGDRGGIIAEATEGGNAGSVEVTTPSLSMSQGARISTTIEGNNDTASAGNVTINARDIDVTGENTEILANTRGSGNAGNLTIQPNAGQLLSIDLLEGAEISASTSEAGTGGTLTLNGSTTGDGSGSIVITFSDMAEISASTSGTGDGGDLILNGRDLIDLQGNGQITVASTGIFEGAGNAGGLEINTNQLSLANGVRISASTITSDGTPVDLINLDTPLRIINSRIEASTRDGNAGSLIVQAPSILLSGFLNSENSILPAGLFAEATGEGNAGFIAISTGRLVVENGAQAAISTQSGTGRTLAVVADSIVLGNEIDQPLTVPTPLTDTGLFARSNDGTSGDITVSNLNTLRIQDGSQLSTTTESGIAGTININSVSPTANDSIDTDLDIEEPDTPAESIIIEGRGSTLSAQANSPGGVAGSVILNVESLFVDNEGSLSASNIDDAANIDDGERSSVIINGLNSLRLANSGRITAETEQGIAGNVEINAQGGTVELSGTGTLLSAQATGQGGTAGSVNLETQQLTITDAAILTAQATQGTGTAGNVFVEAQRVTVADNGTLSASNIDSGQGGNVNLTGLVTLEVLSGGSITASTETGQAGDVQINTREGDRSIETFFIPVETMLIDGEGSRIAAEATGNGGNAGSVQLNVRDLTVSNGGEVTASTLSGTSGGVALSNLNTLNVLAGGSITASTETGEAGDVQVNVGEGDAPVNTILIRGENSRIAAEAEDRANRVQIGAGSVQLNVRELTVRNGGEVTASNQSGTSEGVFLSNLDTLNVLAGGSITASTETGVAGDVLINAGEGDRPVETILIRGTGSRIAAAATGNGGGAGRVQLNVRDLTVRNSGEITASNQSGNSEEVALSNLNTLNVLAGGSITASTETGEAGDVLVNVGDRPVNTALIRGEGSRIAAEATENGGDAGSVQLTVRNLTVRDAGEITASNQSGNSEGVTLSNLNTLHVSEGGSITASTETGEAGNVLVNTQEGDRPVASIRVGGNRSRIAAEAAGGDGVAGSVRLNVQALTVLDSGEVSTANEAGTSQGVFLSRLDRLTMLRGGSITASTARGIAGDVEILLQPGGRVSLNDSSQIASEANNDGTAGSVTLRNSRSLTLDNGSSISVSSNGDGGSGQLTIDSGRVRLSERSRIAAETENGEGGSIQFQNLNTLILRGNSAISASTEGDQAGSVNIPLQTGGTVRLNGGSQIESAATAGGRAGSLALQNGRSLTLNNGSGISVRSTRIGGAGRLFLDSQEVSLDNGSSITATTIRGEGGNIRLRNTETLALDGTSRISASTRSGEAGDVRVILAPEGSRTITLDNSSQIASAAREGGRAGDVTLQNGRELRLNDGSSISVSSPSGEAGRLIITTERAYLDNSQITAQTGQSSASRSEAANIQLQGLDLLLMENGSLISAEALGDATGGNIRIDAADGFVIGIPFEDNDIIANAREGNGGRIRIRTNRILGFENPTEERLDPDTLRGNQRNDINASSRSGVSGTVALDTLSIDPTQGLAVLPGTIVDASNQIGQVCPTGPGASEQLGRFVIVGRGGIAPSPFGLQEDLGFSVDWMRDGEAGVPAAGAVMEDEAGRSQHPFVEADGWQVGPDGQVQLVASSAPNVQVGADSVCP